MNVHAATWQAPTGALKHESTVTRHPPVIKDLDTDKLTTLQLRQDQRDANGYPSKATHPTFVETRPPKTHPHKARLFAIDCEMVKTQAGLEQPKSELARVSVVDASGAVVLDEYVQPRDPVVDYVTRFSGITEDTLRGVDTTLEVAREKVMSLVTSQDILVGHSLETDLKALEMLHGVCLDTAVLYPRKVSPPSTPSPFDSPPPGSVSPGPIFATKRSLRSLSHEFLNMDIQGSQLGHDSREDAKAALQLVLRLLFHPATRSQGALLDTPSLPIPTTRMTHGHSQSLRSLPPVAPRGPPLGHMMPQSAGPPPRVGGRHPRPPTIATQLPSVMHYHCGHRNNAVWVPAGTCVPMMMHSAPPQCTPPNSGRRRRTSRPKSARSKHYKTKPCRFFTQGLCKKGDRCTYRHDSPQALRQSVSMPVVLG